MEKGESKVKQVLSTLWSYMYSSLPPNEDFIIQLEIGGILARNDATKLRASARLGGRACIHDLIIFMNDFFDEPALETFCTFLDKYGQPNRPLMLEVAAKIREEMGLISQPVHEPAPEDPQKGTSKPRADVGDGTSSADLGQNVYYPVIDDLKISFSNLAGNVLSIIGSLSSKKLETFCYFLSNYLKPSCSPDAPLPVIPKTFPVLNPFLIRHWDPLQIKLLKAVVEHLVSSNIQDATFKVNVQQVKAELNAYEDLLKGKLPEFLSKCRSECVSLQLHPGQSSVSVKIASNPAEMSLSQIVKLKDFFIHNLGLPDTLFAGFSEGCIILFFSIPTECVWSLPSCLLPSNLSLLEEWKVLFVSVKGAFTVDIKERRVIDSFDKVPLVVVQKGGRDEDGPSFSLSTTSELSNKKFSDEDAASHLGIVAALDLSEGISQPTVHADAYLAKDPPHRKLETAFFRLQSRLANIFNEHIADLKVFLRLRQKNEEWPFEELEVEDINSMKDIRTIFVKICTYWLNTEIFIRLIAVLPDKKSHESAKQYLEVYHKLLGVFSKYVLLLHIPKDDARLEHFHSYMFPKLRLIYDVNMEDFDVSKLLKEQKFLSKIFHIPEEAFHYLEAERTN